MSPLGNDVGEFFENLVSGHSGIERLTSASSSRRGGPWSGPPVTHIGGGGKFDSERHFTAPKLRMLDRVSQFALAAADQAGQKARIVWGDVEPERAGVFVGTGMGGAQTTDEGYYTLYAEHSERTKPFSVLMAMTNAAASWIGIEYGLTGPNLTFSTACSSSAVAIGEAARRIASGETEIMLAGGSEAPLSFGTLVAWDALKTLACEDAEGPSASCKPFAKDRNGLVLAEGAAILVLEEWQHALGRGAAIHAEMSGYGLHTDAAHITRPTMEGQALTMQRALSDAGMRPEDIGYINAHGTATLANDAVETAAIRQLFGAHAYRVPVSSTKSMHGHLLGAAGGLVFSPAAIGLQEKKNPPTTKIRRPRSDIG